VHDGCGVFSFIDTTSPTSGRTPPHPALPPGARRPFHSNFLVAAAVRFVDGTGVSRTSTGVNSETCVLPSAICAERCAMVSARRDAGAVAALSAVYIAATAPAPISPGMLCREFMTESATPDTRVILFVPGWRPAAGDSAPGLTAAGDIPAGAEALICRLAELFPLPPVYHRVPRASLVAHGTAFAARMAPFDAAAAAAAVAAGAATCAPGLDLAAACAALYASVRATAAAATAADYLYPIHRAAGVLFSDGSVSLAREDKCLEYGCTRDAVVALSAAIAAAAAAAAQPPRGTAPRPVVLIQTDQFGVCTAPAAAPRAWLHEYGHGAVAVPAHDAATGALVITNVRALAPASPAIFL
jgi:cytidine deaminase